MVIRQKCDFCKEPALYDGKTQMGPWAYMCEKHMQQYGFPEISDLFTRLSEPALAAEKVCSICGKLKPVGEFYKYKDARGVERFRTECKQCNLDMKKHNSFK